VVKSDLSEVSYSAVLVLDFGTASNTDVAACSNDAMTVRAAVRGDVDRVHSTCRSADPDVRQQVDGRDICPIVTDGGCALAEKYVWQCIMLAY
jgi:hypothetical protein